MALPPRLKFLLSVFGVLSLLTELSTVISSDVDDDDLDDDEIVGAGGGAPGAHELEGKRGKIKNEDLENEVLDAEERAAVDAAVEKELEEEELEAMDDEEENEHGDGDDGDEEDDLDAIMDEYKNYTGTYSEEKVNAMLPIRKVTMPPLKGAVIKESDADVRFLNSGVGEKRNYAYVSYISNDKWVVGAFIMGYSLYQVGAQFARVILVDEKVSESNIELLEKIYDVVKVVKSIGLER